MSIRKLMEMEIADRTIPVNYTGPDGVTYALTCRGRPDANALTRTMMLEPARVAAKVRHWKTLIPSEWDAQMVVRVLLIREVLVNDEDPTPLTEEEKTRGEFRRYDETEVAKLVVKHPQLFVQLTVAAMDLLGLKVDPKAIQDMTSDPIVKAALGNYLAEEDSNSGASSGPSEQQDITQTS